MSKRVKLAPLVSICLLDLPVQWASKSLLCAPVSVINLAQILVMAGAFIVPFLFDRQKDVVLSGGGLV